VWNSLLHVYVQKACEVALLPDLNLELLTLLTPVQLAAKCAAYARAAAVLENVVALMVFDPPSIAALKESPWASTTVIPKIPVSQLIAQESMIPELERMTLKAPQIASSDVFFPQIKTESDILPEKKKGKKNGFLGTRGDWTLTEEGWHNAITNETQKRLPKEVKLKQLRKEQDPKNVEKQKKQKKQKKKEQEKQQTITNVETSNETGIPQASLKHLQRAQRAQKREEQKLRLTTMRNSSAGKQIRSTVELVMTAYRARKEHMSMLLQELATEVRRGTFDDASK
jgi:hypothetical protein